MHPANFPLAKIAVVVLVATLLAIYLPHFIPYILGIVAIACLALLFLQPRWKFKTIRSVLWLLITFGMFFTYTTYSWKGLNPKELENLPEENIALTIEQIKNQDSLQFRCWAQLTHKIGVELFIKNPSETLQNALPGDRLLMRTQLNRVKPPLNPGQFNYARYLAFHHVYYQAFISDSSKYALHKSNKLQLSKFSFNIRNYLRKSYAAFGFDDQTLGVAAALIFGDKTLLNTETKNAFSAAGAMHLLAVSGLHVGIIYIIILMLFRRNKKQDLKLHHSVLIILMLWVYALITGLSPSVQRAATMFSFLALAKGIGRNSNIFNLLGASIVFLVIFNPLIITEVGFQMSYLAVIGIVCLFPWIEMLFQPKNKVVRWFWTISSVSIAAQIATGMLGFLYFRQFPTYFLISNLFVIPIATLVVWLGAATNISLLISTKLAAFIASIIKFIIQVLNAAVAWVETWPYALFKDAYFTFFDAGIYYAVLILLIVWLYFKNKKLIIAIQVFILVGILFQPTTTLPNGIGFYADSKNDVLLNKINNQVTVYSQNTDPNKLDFILGRYLATHGYFQPKIVAIDQLPRFHFSNQSWSYLITDKAAVLMLDSGKVPSFTHCIPNLILFIEKPIWNIKRINALKPEHIVFSNSLGHGYVNWVQQNGLDSDIQLHLPKIHGPFIHF